ncbi:MAG: hypothetical protein ACXV5Q_13580 [Frankiaceae bacterium]
MLRSWTFDKSHYRSSGAPFLENDQAAPDTGEQPRPALLGVQVVDNRVPSAVTTSPPSPAPSPAEESAEAGRRPGVPVADAARALELERENRELKRANEILLAASSFFARELDPRLPW